MIRRAPLVLAFAAVALSGCSTLSAIGDKIPFLGNKENSSIATAGNRVSVIAFDEKGDIKSGAVTMYQVQQGKWQPLQTMGGNTAISAH